MHLAPILVATGAGLGATAATAGTSLKTSADWPKPLAFWNSLYFVDKTDEKPETKIKYGAFFQALVGIAILSLLGGFFFGALGAWIGAILGLIAVPYMVM